MNESGLSILSYWDPTKYTMMKTGPGGSRWWDPKKALGTMGIGEMGDKPTCEYMFRQEGIDVSGFGHCTRVIRNQVK